MQVHITLSIKIIVFHFNTWIICIILKHSLNLLIKGLLSRNSVEKEAPHIYLFLLA